MDWRVASALSIVRPVMVFFRNRHAIVLMLAMVALGVVGCWRDEPAPPPRDILLIVVDTLRSDHLSLYGYGRRTTPHVDQFFADAAIFERSYSAAGYTPPSVVSILSGTMPSAHQVRSYGRHVGDAIRLLPELLPDAYQSAAFVSSTAMTNQSLGLGGRFDHFDDQLQERLSGPAFQRVARPTTDAVLQWLRTGRDPKRPTFLFVHYIDPHSPYRPPQGWRRRFEGTEPPRPRLVDSIVEVGESYAAQNINEYDEEIVYLDIEIGHLLMGLRGVLDLDDMLIILTADHGETMRDGPVWFAHIGVYEPVLRVPLLVRGPGIAPGRRPGPVSGIDIAPTVLAFAGVERPRDLPGLDLSTRDPDSERMIFSEGTGGTRAVIHGMQKWTLHITPQKEITELHRFDLAVDPAAIHPLAWADPPGEAARLLLAAARQEVKGGAGDEGKIEPHLDPAQREQLRQLGYE